VTLHHLGSGLEVESPSLYLTIGGQRVVGVYE
jgi:hypothetical protein